MTARPRFFLLLLAALAAAGAWSAAGCRRNGDTQAAVPAHAWQAACSLGDWTLVGCTVAPGFEFAGFELAPADWTPGR